VKFFSTDKLFILSTKTKIEMIKINQVLKIFYACRDDMRFCLLLIYIYIYMIFIKSSCSFKIGLKMLNSGRENR
jgi:hypothetical protein